MTTIKTIANEVVNNSASINEVVKENKKTLMYTLSKADAWTKATISNGLRFMERTGFISFPAEIPVDKLVIPEFQRERKNNIINKIRKNFDPYMVEYIVVNYNPNTGKFEIIDGQHTAFVLAEMGFKSIMSKVFVNLTDEQKATIFATQYSKKTRLTGVDEYNTYKWAGMEPAKTIETVSEKHGVTIGRKYGEKKNVTSIRYLNKIVKKYGANGLEFCYNMIEDAGWVDDFKAYTEAILSIAFSAFPHCNNDKLKYDTLISLLSQYPTSTEFVDYCRFNYVDISAKHPERCTRQMIEEFLK